MKNKTILLGVIGLILIGGIAFFATRGGSSSRVATKGGIYCSTDGTLTDTMPIQSHRSYCVKSDATGKFSVSTPNDYSFSIVDDQGAILKDFDVVHEKIMHFIVVRKDLQGFQHIHPEFNKNTGEFSIPVTFATDGEYRMFADFTPRSGQIGQGGERLPVTVYKDAVVGNLANYKPQPLGSTERSKMFGGYVITMIPSSEPLASQNDFGFTFEIKKDGKLVTDLEKYLGALGHTVVLREGDLQFIHAHPIQSFSAPQTGKVTFMITFPETGNYKLFSQFERDGKIITSDFVVNVILGVKSSSGGTEKL